MRKSIVVFSLLITAPLPSRPQSASDLKAKYPAFTAYEVRPGILMMPLFTPDGQVCEVVLERHTTNTTSKTTLNLDSFLTKETIRDLVDEIAPPAVRGKELTGFGPWFGSVTIDGPFVVTKYTYENVLVEVNGINRASGPSGDSIVTIKWLKRTCVGAQQTALGTKEQNGTVQKGENWKPGDGNRGGWDRDGR